MKSQTTYTRQQFVAHPGKVSHKLATSEPTLKFKDAERIMSKSQATSTQPHPAFSNIHGSNYDSHPAVQESTTDPRRPTVDSRIEALRILAQALLHRIESLEERVIDEEDCDLDLHSEVQRFEAELIRSALLRTGGRQRPAARLLRMKVTTLNNKIKRYRRRADVGGGDEWVALLRR